MSQKIFFFLSNYSARELFGRGREMENRTKKMNVEKEMNVDEQAVSGFVAVEKDRPGRDSFISQPKTQFSSSDQQ